MYILAQDDQIKMLSLHEVKRAFPNVSWPVGDVAEETLAKFGVYPLGVDPMPGFDPLTHRVAKAPPKAIDGAWRQGWNVVELTAEEKEAAHKARVPRSVSMAQARIALAHAGLLDAVQAKLESLGEPMRMQALIAWEYATFVSRDGALVNSLKQHVGLDDAALDNLFIAAAQIEL